MKRLAIITTHPIQYNAPLFKMLQERNKIKLKVFYTWEQAKEKIYDPTFGHIRSWDIPLLEGYDYSFVENIAKKPGSHHFFGIDNPTLISEVENYNPDAILVYGWSFKSHLKLLRHFKNKIQIWFRGDSTLLNEPNGFNLKKTLRRLFLNWVYKHVDKALYVGTNNKKYFLAHGLKENQLIFAPHAIDNDRFQYSPLTLDIRKQYNLTNDEVLITYAGKFYEIKNLRLLLQGFKESSNEKLRLLLIGNGTIEKQLKEIADDDKRIVFGSFVNQSQMPSVYKSSNIFILPSKSETWGLGVNEAMACGVPCIISDKVGCGSDLVLHGKNGFIFTYNNQKELKDIFEYVARFSEQQMLQMKLEAIEQVKNFTFENICIAIEKIMND